MMQRAKCDDLDEVSSGLARMGLVDVWGGLGCFNGPVLICTYKGEISSETIISR